MTDYRWNELDSALGAFALATGDGATGNISLVFANCGFAQRQTRCANLSIHSLTPGTWRLRRRIVASQHSSRWDAGEDGFLTHEQNELQPFQLRTHVMEM